MKKTVFLEFFEKMPPRRILFRRSLEEMGYAVIPVYWNRAKSNEGGSEHEFEILIPAGRGKASLLLALPALWRDQWRLLRELSPDVVLAGHFCLLPVALFWRLRHRWKSISILYDAIEQFPQDLSSYFGPLRKIVYPFLVMLENICAGLCSGVLTVDSRDNRIERRLKRWNRRTLVIWNVPSKKDDPDIEAIESLKTKYLGRKVIAFVGGLRAEKGLCMMIEAAKFVKKKYAECLFLLIGYMTDDISALHSLIRREGVSSNVFFVGHMPYKKMLAHLNHAKIGIAPYQWHPSHKDLSAGNARKFFTYMQAGIPMIGPGFGEIGKAVRMVDCGILIDTERPGALARVINQLLDDEKKAMRLGFNGRRAFEGRFNWERESKKFGSFVEEVLK